MPDVADGDGSSSFVFVLPIQPGWEGSLASITLSGPGGSATLDESTDRPMSILRDPRTGRVRGFLSGLPPEARTAAGQGVRALDDPARHPILPLRGDPNHLLVESI